MTRKPTTQHFVAVEHTDEGDHVAFVDSTVTPIQALVDFPIAAIEGNNLEFERRQTVMMLGGAHWDCVENVVVRILEHWQVASLDVVDEGLTNAADGAEISGSFEEARNGRQVDIELRSCMQM